MRSLRAAIARNNVYAWAAGVMRAAGEVRQAGGAYADLREMALASGL